MGDGPLARFDSVASTIPGTVPGSETEEERTVKKKLYVVHAENTAVMSPGFLGVFEGRDMACRVAREQSRNGREAAVIRQSDAVPVAAFHTGVAMPVEDVYLNYPAVWPELYGVDRETLAGILAGLRMAVTA